SVFEAVVADQPEHAVLRPHRRIVVERAVFELEGQAPGDLVVVGDLGDFAVGKGHAIEGRERQQSMTAALEMIDRDKVGECSAAGKDRDKRKQPAYRPNAHLHAAVFPWLPENVMAEARARCKRMRGYERKACATSPGMIGWRDTIRGEAPSPSR